MTDPTQPNDQPHDRPSDQPSDLPGERPGERPPSRTRPDQDEAPRQPSEDTLERVAARDSSAEPPYDVVLLVEQAFSAKDARTIRGLHEAIEAPVRYHLLMPVEDASGRVEAALGGLGTGEMLATPAAVLPEADVEAMQKELLEQCENDVAVSVQALQSVGARATGQSVSVEPVEALASKVKEVDAAEAIIVTRPHVIAEFFHLDWFHRAERKLGVPVLHLVEHENLDEQAGEGEGVWGF